VKNFLRALLLVALCAQAVTAVPQRADTFERVVFIGASASAGYGTNLPPVTLFEKSVRTPHRPMERLASALFFLNPSGEGTRQADRALALKPSLAVGVDYLFWYVYGVVSTEARTGGNNRAESDASVDTRMKSLEGGLAQLARLDFPVAIGDIPDMFDADPGMLSPQQIPSPKALDMANRRIAEWAKSRRDVLILPVSTWLSDMRSGKASLALSQGRTLQHPAEKWLLPDRLHPSKLGAVMLCARLAESLREWTGAPQQEFHFDIEEALRDIGEAP
jgi:hypothetical protein